MLAQENLPSQQKMSELDDSVREMISSCLETLLVEAF